MAKYKIDCDSLDEAKKLDKKLSSKGATNVVRGLGMMGSRTGYYVEFDFDGDVSSLGFGPVGFTKIKDYGFGPYDDDHYQVISFIGELSKTGTAYKSDVLRLLNYHGGGWTPNELQKTIAQNPKYFTQTGITVTLTQEGKRVLKEMSKVFGSSVHDGKIVGEDRIKSASWYRDSTTISDMAKYDVIIWEKGEQNNRYYAGDIDNKEKAMKLFNKAKQLYPNSIVQLIKGDRLIADSAEVNDAGARIIRANSVSVGNSIEGSGGEWLKVISVKRGSSGGVDVKVKSETTGETNSWYFMKGDLVNIRDSAEVTDGKIVGGEGRSMDGIPYGLYQEGGRSYRGFEITSSENGLRKGVYRFYALGGGTVDFGNAARDGQFTENQFQKLIGEGKIQLLDSIDPFEVEGDLIKDSEPRYLVTAVFKKPFNQYREGDKIERTVVGENAAASTRAFLSGNYRGYVTVTLKRLHDAVSSFSVNDSGYKYKKGDKVYYNTMGEKKAATILERIPEGDPKVWGAKGEFYLIQLPYGFKKLTSVLNLSDSAYSAFELIGDSFGDAEGEVKDMQVKVGQIFGKKGDTSREGGSPIYQVKSISGNSAVLEESDTMNRSTVSLSELTSKYVNLDGGKVYDSKAKKMFKVVDKATGKTLLVKATDSMAAVKKIASLKDSNQDI